MANDDINVVSPEDVRLDRNNIDSQDQPMIKSTENSFTEVSLGEKRKKAPRRILHFSDGILEEYSTDEEDCDVVDDKKPLVDPTTLAWIPYMWYLTLLLGSKALSVCDYLGEHLAYFFGITAPKYQYEIEEYKRLVEEEEEEKKTVAAENAGWPSKADTINLNEVQVHEPLKVSDGLEGICSTQQMVTTTSDSQNWERMQ